ncbi:MAG: hypothetical protein VCE75_02175 [Alphaproteobacteria bacterium]
MILPPTHDLPVGRRILRRQLRAGAGACRLARAGSGDNRGAHGDQWQRSGRGAGGDILGHPLNALVWLANMRTARGMPLRQGEFVTLGSLVQTVWIEAGDEVIAEIDGLGRAGLTL